MQNNSESKLISNQVYLEIDPAKPLSYVEQLAPIIRLSQQGEQPTEIELILNITSSITEKCEDDILEALEKLNITRFMIKVNSQDPQCLTKIFNLLPTSELQEIYIDAALDDQSFYELMELIKRSKNLTLFSLHSFEGYGNLTEDKYKALNLALKVSSIVQWKKLSTLILNGIGLNIDQATQLIESFCFDKLNLNEHNLFSSSEESSKISKLSQAIANASVNTLYFDLFSDMHSEALSSLAKTLLTTSKPLDLILRTILEFKDDNINSLKKTLSTNPYLTIQLDDPLNYVDGSPKEALNKRNELNVKRRFPTLFSLAAKRLSELDIDDEKINSLCIPYPLPIKSYFDFLKQQQRNKKPQEEATSSLTSSIKSLTL